MSLLSDTDFSTVWLNLHMDDQHLATSHKIDPKKGNCLQVIHMHIKRLNNFLD